MSKKTNRILKVAVVAMMLVLSLIILTGCGNKADNEAEAKKEFSKGKWEEDVYTNEFADIKFTLPEGWERSTDEEIAATMQLGADVLADEGLYNEKLAELQVVYDMMAKDPVTNASVTVMMEKTTAKETLYINSLKSQLQKVTQVKYEIGDETETTICGNTYKTLTATASTYGITLNQNYYVRNEGDYIVAVLITAPDSETIDKVINSFE